MSSVDNLYRVFCSLQAGYPCIDVDETWCVFRLTTSEYDELHQRIRGDETLRGYYEDKVYYDWEAPYAGRPKGKYVLRQRGSNYEGYFQAQVTRAIKDGLTALALRLEETGDTETAKELSLVRNGGSPPLALSVQKGTENECHIQRSPDVTFSYGYRTYLPTLIAVSPIHSRQKSSRG